MYLFEGKWCLVLVCKIVKGGNVYKMVGNVDFEVVMIKEFCEGLILVGLVVIVDFL